MYCEGKLKLRGTYNKLLLNTAGH